MGAFLRGSLSILLWSLLVPLISTQDDCICLQEVAGGLANPILLKSPPDNTNRVMVAEQRGIVYIYDANWNRYPEPFLNISEFVEVTDGYDERGFLSIAFHPNFQDNRKVFTYYSVKDSTTMKTRLSQFLVDENNPDVIDYTTEITMLELEQPFENHNGAELMFGLDNYLYVSLGDGGDQGDPFGNAQNKGVLLGKILRLDVDNVSENNGYEIPPDNPFVDEADSRPEIYAYGFRNPWRCDVDEGDPITGENAGRLTCGDAGQDAWEEVDILEKGGNFGWNAREGNECFDEELCGNIGPEVFPIYTYSHSIGGIFVSVIGGVIYRGCQNPHLNGNYIFGDNGIAELWQLTENPDTGFWTKSDVNICTPEICTNGLSTEIGIYILSFGEDSQGEVYVLSTDYLGAFDDTGKVFKFINPASSGSCEVDSL